MLDPIPGEGPEFSAIHPHRERNDKGPLRVPQLAHHPFIEAQVFSSDVQLEQCHFMRLCFVVFGFVNSHEIPFLLSLVFV
jgi:hypothetical protein